jgi:hypothetical protein
MNAKRIPLEEDRTLCSVAPQERVRVESIRFPVLRALCADMGLHEGGTLVALAVTPRVLLLRNDAGQPVRLDADWARFIWVTSLDTGETGLRHAGAIE